MKKNFILYLAMIACIISFYFSIFAFIILYVCINVYVLKDWFVKYFLKNFTTIYASDAVKHCALYKRNGCAHVDGILCNYEDCSMRLDFIKKHNKKHYFYFFRKKNK